MGDPPLPGGEGGLSHLSSGWSALSSSATKLAPKSASARVSAIRWGSRTRILDGFRSRCTHPAPAKQSKAKKHALISLMHLFIEAEDAFQWGLTVDKRKGVKEDLDDVSGLGFGKATASLCQLVLQVLCGPARPIINAMISDELADSGQIGFIHSPVRDSIRMRDSAACPSKSGQADGQCAAVPDGL